MKKKLQVFISSTYTDLIEERQAAVEAVLDAGHIPAGMELFKAGNRSQLETIYRWIDDSDVYMLILGGRYGSVEEESGKSYTHLEYDYAINSGIPVFAVVLDDDFLDIKQKEHDEKFIYEIDNISKYADFKSLVMSKIIRLANDVKDIKLAIHTTLNDFLDEYECVGWVRGNDTEANNALLVQVNNLNQDNQRLQKENNAIRAELKQIRTSFSESLAFEGEEIEIKGTYEVKRGSGYIQSSMSEKIAWDKLFLLWAPRLMSTLNAYKAKEEMKWALKDYMGQYLKIKDDVFNTIKIQYHALGLIRIFEATTTTGGTAEFIELTKVGREYLIREKAIKKRTSLVE